MLRCAKLNTVAADHIRALPQTVLMDLEDSHNKTTTESEPVVHPITGCEHKQLRSMTTHQQYSELLTM